MTSAPVCRMYLCASAGMQRAPVRAVGHARPRALAAHKVHREAGGRKARRVLVVAREAQRPVHDLAQKNRARILGVLVCRAQY